jgi:hypothetical protein
VNHYERLKVTQDAPAEVIRAAYRALAQAIDQNEHREAQLTALNTAYETLIDPQTRQAYDAILQVVTADILGDTDKSGIDIALDALAMPPDAPPFDHAPDTPAAEPDMVDPWQAAFEGPAFAPPRHWSRQPVVWMGGGLVLLMMSAAGVGLWQMQQTNQITQGMAVQYSEAASGVPSMADVPADLPVPVARTGAADDAVTVEDLSRMSDEELLEALPKLDTQARTSRDVDDLPSVIAKPRNGRGAATARHPLDGAPLDLRTDGDLIDPLAQPATSPRGR